ncbi:Orotate phosphoribosyltransferase [Rhizoctonia solani]|uniref:Orotate phosphoribosyltransferase n=1 Tax=Rhizoctonia solani TaxID=456999 RepID=A0A8H7I6J4_9AGAM|nr:Orotate phosphoribosyltransferase [Rhizoctonia solani]
MSTPQSELRAQFIQGALEAGALKFGQFTLNQDVYLHTSLMPDFSAPRLFSSLASSYASLIASEFTHDSQPTFDVLFGPAYKGIPLAAATSLTLLQHNISTSFAYNRKESKSHGEGGTLVGASLEGKRGYWRWGRCWCRRRFGSGGGCAWWNGSTMKDVEAEIKKRTEEWETGKAPVVGEPKVRAAVRMRDLFRGWRTKVGRRMSKR